MDNWTRYIGRVVMGCLKIDKDFTIIVRHSEKPEAITLECSKVINRQRFASRLKKLNLDTILPHRASLDAIADSDIHCLTAKCLDEIKSHYEKTPTFKELE